MVPNVGLKAKALTRETTTATDYLLPAVDVCGEMKSGKDGKNLKRPPYLRQSKHFIANPDCYEISGWHKINNMREGRSGVEKQLKNIRAVVI